ncbi:hypothetical protein JB92DRAFT_2887791 [Gautieria morchelliformis]|nr:hypothetical protein JB92DRAFT_2887791 [Gautieria morchelliformis]
MYEPAYREQSNGYDGSNPGSAYNASAEQSPYEYSVDGADQPSNNLYGHHQTNIRQGSFADVGAAFGFHPDLPIQISSQNLPQSPSSHLEGYSSIFQHPSQLFLPPPITNVGQTLPDEYHAGWTAERPSSESRHGKRPRMSQDDSEEDEANDARESAESPRRPARLPGACVHCKGLKVKCEFSPGQDVCNRCRSGKKECIVMGRKPRRAPPKREELLNRIRELEALVKDLQGKLDLATHGAPESALSPSSIALRSPSPQAARVQDKDIQDWIDKARESANVSGDLDPSAVSTVDDHERLSAQEESEDGEEEDGVPESLSESLVRGSGPEGSTRSPAVGTALSPIGLIASSALRKKRGKGSAASASVDGDRDDVGVANASYFRPGMSTNPELRWSVRESQPPPRILASSLVSPREVDKLFEIYFDCMNLSVSLLDPKIYTAQTTYWRSPFLFTVICAVASRYLTERAGLYPVLMNYAKMEAGQALVAGLKSPELVAGYILLSLYPVPSARWEEDRGWLMLGVAIRMATDLNLHHSLTAKITNEQQAREVANRTRIWINCYNLDRSTSTQFGKPSTIREDYIARHSKFWYRTSKFNYDIHLSAYTQVLRVMAHFHEAIYSDPDAPTGLNKAIDFEVVTRKYEQELLDHWVEWEPRFKEESDCTDLHCLYRIELLRLVNAYSRLVILSFRFQNAFQNGLSRGDPFLQRCLDTAAAVVTVVVDRMSPHPFLRTAPDAQFVFASFASVFLLKLLRPRFASVLESHQKDDIINLVGRLIDVLQSDKVAIDDRHTPKLYARFLAGLLERHTSSHRSSRSSEPLSETDEPTFAITIEQPQETLLESHASHPVYHPPIVTPPSPKNLSAPSIHDGASSVSDTIPAHSHASSAPTVPDTIMTDEHSRTDDGMLATMRAIANPTFWDDMMMPGFSWTPLENQTELFQQYAST